MGHSENELMEARKFAAKPWRDFARDLRTGKEIPASHSDPMQIALRNDAIADEIESGSHDDNFTVWQAMQYFLTGKEKPLL